MKYTVNYSCISHIGKCRGKNQDNYICDGKYKRREVESMNHSLIGNVHSCQTSLFGIFDGMGGEECGEEAALIAAQIAAQIEWSRDIVDDILNYCKRANLHICKYSERNKINSMGTTAAMLVFSSKAIVLCNIGDSKVFLFSDGRMEQISYDHVVVSAYGTKPPLSQNLGIPPEEMCIEPYVSIGEYHAEDRYLICSDGLTDMVKDDEIKNIVLNSELEGCAEKLLQKALDNGGRDNITIIMCEIKRDNNGTLGSILMSKRRKGEK